MARSRYFSGIVAAAVVGLAGASALASSVAFVGTATNPDSSTKQLKAEADFMVSDGQIVVTLTNFTDTTKSVAEVLTQINFSISGHKSATGMSSAIAADLVDIQPPVGNPTVTDLGSQSIATEWALASGNTLTWNGGTGPDYGIIGPDPWNLANSSIVGNGPHNPFVVQTATFTLTGSSIKATDTISDVSFFFGTTPTFEFCVPTGTPTGGGSPPPTVPLPAAAWGGMALMSALGIGKKIRQKIRG